MIQDAAVLAGDGGAGLQAPDEEEAEESEPPNIEVNHLQWNLEFDMNVREIKFLLKREWGVGD